MLYWTALLKIAPQQPQRSAIQRRSLRQPRVLEAIAGYQREGDASGLGESGQLLDAVAPVLHAPEQSHQNEPRARTNRFEIEIDGIGMFQRGEIRQPQAGARLAHSIPSRGESREVAIGERQQHDLGGRLPEIDRFGRLVEGACFDPRDMHRLSRPQHGFDRAAVETLLANHDESAPAGLALCPRTVEITAKSLADALDQQAHRLARDFDIAFHAQDVMRARRLAEPREQRVGVGDGGQVEHEGIEIVVIVLVPKRRDARA